ncbi:helix-turn-helix domain-containing protein [Microlunatus sp. GCM10028923]|uniref:helix-turn-helix domain-containing protein n=1 Tax=Microlunatus sp. GCM10028923 TaxID=3273400 RepID=UPI00362091F4
MSALQPMDRAAARVRPEPAPFSYDELRMIALFAEGLCLDTIARRLNLSDRTVRRRARSVCDRLGAGTMIQVVAWAARHRFI